jgi:hypothetical protein
MNTRKQTRELAGPPSLPDVELPQIPKPPQDRRLSLRYALHARVVFGWKDRLGEQKESRGKTRDVGQKGTYILATECPPAGAAVSLSIFLPLSTGEKRVMQIDADGNVLRAEHTSGPTELRGFAVGHKKVNLLGN